ncbi:helix-turn-helix domain-containing protein, partial [Vibrio hyugaensis]|uniref:helix-turn-helix domain-containing protein n=1 Tax=Vibrio hyugaensis TaxID=1534743 RepID=UPI003CC8178A
QLSQYIKRRASEPSGGRLTGSGSGSGSGSDIHAYIIKEFGKHYDPDSIYYLLNRMGFSWITSRSKHPSQSQQLQDDFKKNSKLKRSSRSQVT